MSFRLHNVNSRDNVLNEKKSKVEVGEYAMKRVGAGAHLPTPLVFLSLRNTQAI